MNGNSTFTPTYFPKLHDLVYIQIPELSSNDIPYRIVSVVGSRKQNKVTALCSQGNGSDYQSAHLIWKRGQDSWMIWFLGKQYKYVKVQEA